MQDQLVYAILVGKTGFEKRLGCRRRRQLAVAGATERDQRHSQQQVRSHRSASCSAAVRRTMLDWRAVGAVPLGESGAERERGQEPAQEPQDHRTEEEPRVAEGRRHPPEHGPEDHQHDDDEHRQQQERQRAPAQAEERPPRPRPPGWIPARLISAPCSLNRNAFAGGRIGSGSAGSRCCGSGGVRVPLVSRSGLRGLTRRPPSRSPSPATQTTDGIVGRHTIPHVLTGVKAAAALPRRPATGGCGLDPGSARAPYGQLSDDAAHRPATRRPRHDVGRRTRLTPTETTWPRVGGCRPSVPGTGAVADTTSVHAAPNAASLIVPRGAVTRSKDSNHDRNHTVAAGPSPWRTPVLLDRSRSPARAE